MKQVHEHLRHLDGEVGGQVREALEEARAQLHEHIGPQEQKQIDEAMQQVHEHLGHVDGEVRQHVEEALREARRGLAEGQQEWQRALREAEAGDALDPAAHRVRALKERIRAAEDRARARADAADGDADADEQRVVERVHNRLRQRTDANNEADVLRQKVEHLEQQLAEMRAKLHAVERRKQ
jgi:chromosome segregation ATPase